MFVFPARDFVALPEVFERFVTRPQAPLELDAAEIAAQRDQWIEQWTQVVLR
jgi:thiamine transport system substrate-binding protein